LPGALGLAVDLDAAVGTLEEMPDRVEEEPPDRHANGQAEQRLEQAAAKLPDVLDERHPRLGVLPPGLAWQAEATRAWRRDRVRRRAHLPAGAQPDWLVR